MKTIIRDNINKNDTNYLVHYKCSIDDYKKYYNIIMNKEEKDYILQHRTAQNGKIKIKEV